MPWSKEVDVLEAKNINRGYMVKNENCRCIIGWFVEWFGYSNKEFYEAREVAQAVTGARTILSWNDNRKHSKAEIATAINKVTATLGYTVNNPEAKNI